jgi:hypothetical protein
MARMRAQDVGKRVNNPRPVAPIGDLRSKPGCDPHATLRQCQQHHAAVGTDATAIKGGGDLLAPHHGSENGNTLSSVTAGLAASD